MEAIMLAEPFFFKPNKNNEKPNEKSISVFPEPKFQENQKI